MRLKKIELYGFKSFAKKTTLQFDEDFVAIVGPNGSGKSNISDAVRWVLGEQSAKALRGEKMEDVIFAGSAGKPAMNLAQVTMVFDNADGLIPLDFEEVSVSRKVYRNGESQYLINNRVVRRKDVHELFLDTGVGKEGYSLIGQGRIEEILSTRSEDRRAVFEEAAGIAKFKYKKVESEHRLQQTEAQWEEITREKEMHEAEARLLKKQAENAREGMRLVKELEQHELSLLQTQLTKVKASGERAQADLSQNEENLKALQETLAAVEQKAAPYEEFFGEYETLRTEMDERREHLQVQIRQAEAAISVAREKKEFYAGNLVRWQEEAKLAASQKEDLTQHKMQAAEEYHRLEETLAALTSQKSEMQPPETESEADQLAREKASNRLEEIREALARLAFQKEAAQEQDRMLSEEQENQRRALADLQKQLESLEQQKLTLIEESSKRSAEEEARRAKLRAISEESQTLSATLEEDEEKKRHWESEKSGLAAKERMLQSLMAQYEGYQRSVQNLLRLADRRPDIKAHMVGTLADLIHVKKGYETAVDVALGAALQNIVVPGEQDAKALIAVLKEQRLGRVTFLPLDRIRGMQPVYSGQAEELCNGTEAVETAPELANIIEHFLARTTFVKSIDDAMRLSHVSGFRNRIVSLDGDVINNWGSMVGGSLHRRQEAALFNREEELLSARTQQEKILRELEALNQRRQSVRLRMQKAAEERQSCLEALDALQAASAKAAAAQATLAAQRTHLESQIAGHQKFLAQEAHYSDEAYQRRRQALEEEQTNLREVWESLESRKQSREQEKIQWEQAQMLLQKELDLTSRSAETARQRYEEQEAQWTAWEARQGERDTQMAEAKKVIQTAEETLRARGQQKDAWEQDALQLAEEAKRLRERYETQHAAANALLQEKQQLEKQMQDFENEAFRIRVQWERSQEEEASLLEAYRAQYDLTEEIVQERLSNLTPIATTRKRVNEIKQSLSQIGYFNVETIDQYQQLAEELKFLEEQLADLEASRADIAKLIRELDQTMEEMFSDGFRRINEEYNRIFQILFHGGRANLRLDGENLLTAGVEIEAQPPGKKLQNLTLLSGGERSMTALALLFAIFSIHPTPFCILDEIDASLDEANIGRYVEYLQTLRDQTQFIVITHRKTTMQLAEMLYGVTMQEGITNVVFLRFADYDETREAAMLQS